MIRNESRLFSCRYTSCSNSPKVRHGQGYSTRPPHVKSPTALSFLWGPCSATFRSPRKTRQGASSLMTFLGHRRLRAPRLSCSQKMTVVRRSCTKMRLHPRWPFSQEAALSSVTRVRQTLACSHSLPGSPRLHSSSMSLSSALCRWTSTTISKCSPLRNWRRQPAHTHPPLQTAGSA